MLEIHAALGAATNKTRRVPYPRRKGDSHMKQLIVNTMNRVNSVSICAQARNAFAGFFSYVYFYFYFYFQTKLRSLTRPAAC